MALSGRRTGSLLASALIIAVLFVSSATALSPSRAGAVSEYSTSFSMSSSSSSTAEPFAVTLNASPMSGPSPTLVNFTGSISGGVGPYTYRLVITLNNESDPFNPKTIATINGNADGQNFKTEYPLVDVGTYTASVTVTDNNGDVVWTGVSGITIFPPPFVVVGSVTPMTGPAPLNCNLTAVVTGGLAPYNYKWVIYQETVVNGQIQYTLIASITNLDTNSWNWKTSYTFANPGEYVAYLTVWSDDGVQSSFGGIPITVFAPPPPPPMP